MTLFNKLVFKDFAKARYLEIVKRYPRLQEEKTQMYLMLSLTFLSLSFLGIFAINPTLTTITELNKKLEDSKYANDSLKSKIANLSTLNTQYRTYNDFWPLLDNAIPYDPQVANVLGQIQSVAKDNNVSVFSLQSYDVELTKRSSNLQKESSFVFSVTVEGTEENLLNYLQAISAFNRTISIESISFIHENTQRLTVRARAFFLP